MLSPPCFTIGMVPCFLQTWRLAFRPKSSILVSPDQRILFLMVWESLGAFWQTPSRLSCAFYWGVPSIWPLYHEGLIGGMLQRWLSFWKVLPPLQRNCRALSEWPSRSWSPPWPRPFFLDCSFWLGGQLWKSLGGSKFHPFMNDGSHCGDLQCCRMFLVPFPRSVPWHNPVSAL